MVTILNAITGIFIENNFLFIKPLQAQKTL